MKTMSLTLALALVWCVSAGAADLRVVYNEDYTPLSFREKGVMKGILIDLMDELGRRVGVTVSHQGYPWERAQLLVRTGEADAFVTLVNPVRAEYAVAAPTAILKVSNVGVTSTTNPRISDLRAIRTLAQAERFSHVNFIGSGWAKAELVKASVTWVSSMSGIFQMLLNHRADLFLESELLIEYNAQTAQVGSHLEILPAVFGTVEFHVQVSKKSPWAQSIASFEGASQAMVDDGTVQKILDRYGRLAVPRTISEHP